MPENDIIISLAPLQGYTDAIFRNAINSCIGGISRFYAPYFKVEKDGHINPKYIRDIQPENNQVNCLIPQILTNSADEFKIAIPIIQKMGYNELNWNLGCPYPMVTKRQLGSGLLPHPERIDTILSNISNQFDMAISVKLRAGYLRDDEIFAVLEVLNRYPVKEIIFHPRIGKQLYKGSANRNLVQPVMDHCQHRLAYNGDICSLEQARQMVTHFPGIRHLMIGRGLLYNPFLGKEISENTLVDTTSKRKIFSGFHEQLLLQNRKHLSGPGHLHTKMVAYWEFFSYLFVNQHKIYKALKKSRSLDAFDKITEGIIKGEELLNDVNNVVDYN